MAAPTAAEKKAAAEAEKAAADKAAADKAEAELAAASAPEGDVTVIVAEAIGGLRNGEPWPAVGEPITLPAAEAASYLTFGYVREVEPAE